MDKQIKGQLHQQGLTKGLAFLDDGKVKEAVNYFDLVEKFGFGNNKEKVGSAYYRYGKILLQNRDFNRACIYFSKAHSCIPQNQLIQNRTKLIQTLIEYHSTVVHQLFLSEFAARLEIGSVQIKRFKNDEYLEYSESQGLISPKKIDTKGSPPCEIYILGAYHPRQPGHKWTRAIRHYKKDRKKELEDPLALLMADYLFKKTGAIKDIDYIIPIPPDPQKYSERGNFAPNDDISEKLGRLLAAPVAMALLRKSKKEKTRNMNLDEKVASYEFDSKYKTTLINKGILLVEDVTTTRETLLANMIHLLDIKPISLYVIILGETGG